MGHPGATESPVYSFGEHGEEDPKWTLPPCGLADAAPRVVSTRPSLIISLPWPYGLNDPGRKIKNGNQNHLLLAAWKNSYLGKGTVRLGD